MNIKSLKKNLVFMIASVTTGLVCLSTNASDQEIYNIGFTAKPVVMFALDNSGSMSVQNGRRRAYDLKDSMQAVLLGDNNIQPARNIRAGVSVFESAYWYPIFQDNDKNKAILYYTAVHPATSQVKINTAIKVPRRDAGQIISPALMLDDYIVYPSSRMDRIPSNGDVISRDGNTLGHLANTSYTLNRNTKKAYIRFQADIPRGATIKSAYLEMRSNNAYNASGRLNVRVAKHNSLYSANPSVTNLQTYNGTDTNKRIAAGVDRSYLDTIFNSALSAVQINPTRTEYDNDNIASPMRIYSIDVKSQLDDLITSNQNWCGMGDIVFELQRATNYNFSFYADREDRVNPQLHIEWELTDNAKRTNNCMYTDTKRTSAKIVRNLGNANTISSMRARQSMNLQIQRIVTDTATPSTSLYAETIAYLLGNSTKPLTNTNPVNTTIDQANGLTTGSGPTIQYVSPVESIRDYQLNPNSAKNTDLYRKEQQCGQHGIYFLTDGEAEFNQRGVNNTNDKLFANSLGWSSISCSDFNPCVRLMAASLVKDSGAVVTNRNVKVKTFTVGFNYSGSALSDWAKAGGGTYTEVNENTAGGAKQGIVNSINAFLDNVFSNDIPETVLGSPTLPVDPLIPTQIQPYAYYSSFQPKLDHQLWVGNINKYNVINGQLYGANGSKLFDDATGIVNTNIVGLWQGGAKENLDIGVESDGKVNRLVYTNRVLDNGLETEDNALHQVTSNSYYVTADSKKQRWFNILGYKATAEDSIDQFIGQNADLKQLGAILHSSPILISQKGMVSNGLSVLNRDDYLVYGSTQGVLHILDKTGKEVFAFVPHEMLVNQPEAFESEELTTSSSARLFYGIDGAWTILTQYVANNDGSLTVGRSDRSTENNYIDGKQYLYGGLRMGGRSYYALDLTHFADDNLGLTEEEKGVKLKFHINPKDSNSEVINSDGKTTVQALNFMGQSWSKPTLVNINFAGQNQKVMIVGGGYDSTGMVTCTGDDRANNQGYECPSYNQTNKKGAGVYIFNAENGELLWWASANATSALGAKAHMMHNDLKYSVVSQINAIDRNGDGLVDNLYFGDLGGQVFRIDLDNTKTTLAHKIDAKVTRILNHNVATGVSPRFYEMPSFSVHQGSNSTKFGIVALSSGNRSSPLSGGDGINQLGSTVSANDGIFILFDKDVGSSTLFTQSSKQDYNLSSLAASYSTGVSLSSDGWYYPYGHGAQPSPAGVYKGFGDIYAVDSIIYASVYHRDGVGVTGQNSCASGVRGDTYLYRFCLPTGNCDLRFPSPLNNTGAPDRIKLGAGILGTGLSSGSNGLLVNVIANQTNCNDVANKNKIECQSFTPNDKIRTLRWYETR